MRLFTKTVAAIAFVIVGILGTYDAVTDELDFASVVIVFIAAAGAIGFALAAWADQPTPPK